MKGSNDVLIGLGLTAILFLTCRKKQNCGIGFILGDGDSGVTSFDEAYRLYRDKTNGDYNRGEIMIEYPRIILSEVMQEKSGLNKEGSGRNFLMKAYRCLKGVEEKQVVFHRKSTMAERLREVSANTPAKEPDYKYINVINRTSKTAFYDDVRRKIEYLTGIDIEPIHFNTFRKNGRYIIRLDTSELSNNERLRIESSVVKLKLRSEGYSTSRGGWYWIFS